MQKAFLTFFILFQWILFAQSDQLALDYFEKGEFDKALTLLEPLLEKQPSNSFYFDKVIFCYQQLQQYSKAEDLIVKRSKKSFQPYLLIEEGYNWQLQKQENKAHKKYEEALKTIENNPNYAYQIGSVFEKKTLPKWALKAYQKGQELNPNINFDYQIALLYGQMGQLDEMTNKLLDYAYSKPDNIVTVQNYLTRFLLDDASESFNASLKKALLIRTQKTPDVFWNQFLSWYYVQQKEYGKAFVQEKAVFKRDPESLYNIISLAKMAVEDQQTEDAATMFEFILANTQNTSLQIEAEQYLMQTKIANADAKDYPTLLENMKLLLKKYGFTPYTLELQIMTAHFEVFYLNDAPSGITLLQQSLDLPLNTRQAAKIKMELADIFLYDTKFNQAILYYAQIEDNLKNDEMAHEASMKMAKANYYKKDFDWALQNVKVLKQSPSLLIANDALELFLLIQDNSVEDSTKTALKAFAEADLKLYQNKKKEALTEFLQVVEQHKGEKIEDAALCRIAGIYNDTNDFTNALSYYDAILTEHKESVYTDEALFFSGEIYNKDLNDPEKAKIFYEKIIFEHQDSIYYTEARRQYRILRGDTNI
ncbi:tetratricopeptide repeat protein [Flavobacterium sp. U410]